MSSPRWRLTAVLAALASTPPMGWNSWYKYGKAIDEQTMREQVEVASGP